MYLYHVVAINRHFRDANYVPFKAVDVLVAITLQEPFDDLVKSQ